VPTMIQAISEYYLQKGFDKVYINTNKEPRKVATLHRPDGSITSMSYAKYLYTSHYKTDVAEGDQVDHINGDKMDDRIENLQVLSRNYNNKKDREPAKYVMCICPVCGCEFIFPKRNINSHPNPCCSRKCGGIKSYLNSTPRKQ